MGDVSPEGLCQGVSSAASMVSPATGKAKALRRLWETCQPAQAPLTAHWKPPPTPRPPQRLPRSLRLPGGRRLSQVREPVFPGDGGISSSGEDIDSSCCSASSCAANSPRGSGFPTVLGLAAHDDEESDGSHRTVAGAPCEREDTGFFACCIYR
mmetsp:Transcript_25596/g.55897  ORF Transcript_25596/g.55897 Transcript_25596/m.55897 type:complete len:154 (+) Transcript_25596:155-616(+)